MQAENIQIKRTNILIDTASTTSSINLTDDSYPFTNAIDESLHDDDDVIFVSCTKLTAGVIDLCSPLAPKSRKRRYESVRKLGTNELDNKRTEDKESESASPTKSFICAICMESPMDKQPQSTICGHIFCYKCIQACVQKLKKCAVCTRKLNVEEFHPIFY